MLACGDSYYHKQEDLVFWGVWQVWDQMSYFGGGGGGSQKAIIFFGFPLNKPQGHRFKWLTPVRPYQFDVLFHEYGDSLFCQNDL